jgi:hypothetical protein
MILSVVDRVFSDLPALNLHFNISSPQFFLVTNSYQSQKERNFHTAFSIFYVHSWTNVHSMLVGKQSGLIKKYPE